MYYILFIHSLIDGHLGCTQIIILSKFYKHLSALCGHKFSFLLGKYLVVELLGQIWCVYLKFYKKLPTCYPQCLHHRIPTTC